MTEAVASLIRQRGLSDLLLVQLPNRWERLGDIVVLPISSFRDSVWDSIGGELWSIIAKSLNTYCLARARAKLVYACEWNPHAVETLKRNLEANSVSDRCIILEGDNRITAPKG